MSDIMEHILARRSIRKFTDEPVDPALIRKLLEAAMAAPSASDRRPWEFVVVRDPEALQRLRRGLPFGRQNAPLAIVVCGNKRRALPGPAQSFWVHDCSAAMENLLLAAHGLGLGAVWVGVQPLAPLRWAVSRVLDLPKSVVPLGVANIGHPAEERPPRTRYEEARVHWERFGGTLSG